MCAMQTFYTGSDTSDPCVFFEVNITGYDNIYHWTVTRHFQHCGRRLGLLEPIYSEIFSSAQEALEDAKKLFPHVVFSHESLTRKG